MPPPTPLGRPAALLLALAGAALAAWATEAAGPGREKVLKQVRVPLHYYYRELYLPQATSGVSSPAWSPDGRELALSIEGALYRVDPATGVARQLTDGVYVGVGGAPVRSTSDALYFTACDAAPP